MGWRWWAAVATIVLAIAAATAPVLVSPFGDSIDGVNAAVWGHGSRKVREDLGGSRLGSVADHRVPAVYVNHPPLLVPAAAAAEAVAGERPWATRLPGLLGTLAAAVALALLLHELVADRSAALLATALAMGCPLVRTYGAMLDTPMVGLPFGLGVLLLWQRERNGRGDRTWLWVPAAAAAVLTSWLGWTSVAAAVVGLAAARRWRSLAAAAGGAVAGAVAYLAWAAHGAGLDGLVDVFVERASGAAPGRQGLLPALWTYLTSALPPWTLLVALPASLVAVADRRTRPVAIASLASVVLWIGLFRNRAATNEFWLWWIVVPAGIGWALVLAAALPALRRSLGPGSPLARLAPVVAAGAAIVGLLLPGPGWNTWRSGLPAGELVRDARWPPDQQTAWVLAGNADDLAWIGYHARRPVRTVGDLGALARDRPGDLVLAPTGPPPEGRPEASCLAGWTRGGYALAPAHRMEQALSSTCAPPRP